jgi:acetyltransferase-like isoleucine patch superfamily enzyme
MSHTSRLTGKLRSVIRNLPWRVAYKPRPGGVAIGPRVASRLRKWWVLYRHPLGTVRFEEPVNVGPGFSLYMPADGTFIVGPGTDFRRGFRAEIWADGRIVIGTGVVFTHSPLIQCTTSVEFGDRSMIGAYVTIVDGNHRFRDPTVPILGQGYDYSPVRIEDDVWVGHQATIIGANIGRRAIVAAGAVVVKDVPPYAIVGGVPARVLSYYGPGSGEPAVGAEGWSEASLPGPMGASG